MYLDTAIIIGMIFAIAAAITASVLIVPDDRREQMTNSFLIFLHNLFNFKQLYIEIILKFVYILATCATVFIGFFSLFVRYFSALISFGIMILGPVLIRISYELLMLIVLLVKNTIEINSKLPSKTAVTTPMPVAPVSGSVPVSAPKSVPEPDESST